MSRMPRFFVNGCPLHLIQRGNNRQSMFNDAEDLAFYRTCMAFSAHKHSVEVHAYVLMSNHVHVLATPCSPVSVPKMMQSIGRVYVAYYNERHARTGTLWEGRYKASIVESARYFLTCMRYVEQNPVRAGMVSHPAAYAWSSHAANAFGAIDSVISHHPIYTDLGSCPGARQQAYRHLFADTVAETDLATIRDATHHGWALGGASFCAAIGARTRRAERTTPGRHKVK